MAHKNILTITALATALALAGCGGGGSQGYFNNSSPNPNTGGNGGGGTTDPSTPGTSTAELLSIGLSKSSLNAGGSDQLTVTIRTLDTKGGIIPNAEVKLAIEDASHSGANLSTPTTVVTDENGVVTTDIILANSNLSQRINRTIRLSVTSGSLEPQIIEIPVNGTALTITSDVSLLEDGDNAQVTLVALDAVGTPLSNATASLTDAQGNTVGESKSTDSNGKAVFTIPYSTVLAAPSKTLQLNGKISVDGANQTVNNLLTTDSVTLIANVANSKVQKISDDKPVGIGEPKEIIVKITGDTQAELAGKNVTFATTNGEVSNETAPIVNIRQENGKWVGEASTQLFGAVASMATVSAQFGNNTIYIAQKINAGAPSTITLQSETSVLAPGANTKVIALVKDKNGSPVPNAVVNFKIEKDTSSTGRISQPTAVTDSAGRATVIYTAGTAQTLGGEVQIGAYTGNAQAPQPIYSPTLRLTVATQSAFITLAQNHEVVKEDGDDTHYYKYFSASVVDTAGNAIANQKISIAVDGTHFMKGYFEWVRDFNYLDGDLGWSWYSWLRWSRDYYNYDRVNNTSERITTFIECPSNEFPNPVAILSQSGDVLGTTASFTTDSQGKFDFKVRYGRNYSNWVRVDLKASTTVSTKDNITALSFVPPVASDDVDDDDGNWRPDRVSPYGTDYSTCLNYR